MSFLLLSSLALQAPAAAPLSCSLVTPSAEAVDLTLADTLLVPQTGSIWPSAPVRGVRQRQNLQRIVLGGRGGLVFEIGRSEPGRPAATALLSRWDGKQPTYPVAVGICRPAPVATAGSPVPPAAVGSGSGDVPAFDPARWPEDCGMLLGDGRRVRFDYTLTGPGGDVRIESPVLWGNKPVTTRWADTRFGGRTGPAGSERMLGHGNIRVKIIHFSRIGDPAVSAQTGLGICGYSNVVRRPNVQ